MAQQSGLTAALARLSQGFNDWAGEYAFERTTSFVGLFVMMGLAVALGKNRRRIDWRPVVGGLALQFAFALLILRTAWGQAAFQAAGTFFTTLLDFVDAGSTFVFGQGFQEHFIAFKILPTIIFFSALMSLLYHFGVVQWVVRGMAWLMVRTLGTSGAESLSASANVFVGQTEAPLVVKPYLNEMTDSELMAVMVGGFATVAGGVFAAYVGFGVDAGHLLSASVISAPAALLIAKLMQPEVDQSATLGEVRTEVQTETVNAIHALANGTSDGLKLALNVGAMLLVFLAVIAMVDFALAGVGSTLHTLIFDPERSTHSAALAGWARDALGGDFGLGWSLAAVLGAVFAPLAFLMGVEVVDARTVGEVLGLKTVANEFIAYEKLGPMLPTVQDGVVVQPGAMSVRSGVIATYALCGFANFGSIGIQIGGLGPLAPDKQPNLARLGLRAMIGGTLAAFMTACIAGLLV